MPRKQANPDLQPQAQNFRPVEILYDLLVAELERT